MRRTALLLALPLAACGSGPGAPSGNAAAPTRLTAVQERVVTMTDARRRGVLLRAALDAGETCQGVGRATRLPDRDGRPTWAARCVNGPVLQVSVGPDGVAQVTQLIGKAAEGG